MALSGSVSYTPHPRSVSFVKRRLRGNDTTMHCVRLPTQPQGPCVSPEESEHSRSFPCCTLPRLIPAPSHLHMLTLPSCFSPFLHTDSPIAPHRLFSGSPFFFKPEKTNGDVIPPYCVILDMLVLCWLLWFLMQQLSCRGMTYWNVFLTVILLFSDLPFMLHVGSCPPFHGLRVQEAPGPHTVFSIWRYL